MNGHRWWEVFGVIIMLSQLSNIVTNFLILLLLQGFEKVHKIKIIWVSVVTTTITTFLNKDSTTFTTPIFGHMANVQLIRMNSKAQFFCRYEKFVYGFCVKLLQTASIANADQRPDTFSAYFILRISNTDFPFTEIT